MINPSLATPGYDHAMQTFARDVIDKVVGLDPVLSAIPIRSSEHGGTIRNLPGEQSADTELRLFQQTMIIDWDVIRFSRIDEYVAHLYEMGKEFQDQLGKELVDTIIATSEAAGTVIESHNRPLDWEMILEILEGIPYRFAADGTLLSKPMVLLNPATGAQLEQVPHPLDLEQRVQEIEDRKRREYFAQKRTRRIY